MARTKISEFSSTPGSNTDIDGINIAEGCAPSGINDAIRELMAQLKDFQAGTAGDSFNGPVGTSTAAAGAFTTLSASGAVTLSGGTANGVAYLDGSKVLTTGSALTFDGSTLATTGALTVNGNTTLGDATTDTVTVNGYMGVGIAPSVNVGLFTRPSGLTTTTQIGVLGGVLANSAATALVAGVYGEGRTAASAFTVSNLAALYANNTTKGAGSTITNQHGLYVADQSQGTNNYGITSLVSSGTNKFNIYASGTAANYFAGNVGIGTSSPSELLTVGAGSASVNSVLYLNGGSDSTKGAGIKLAKAGTAFGFIGAASWMEGATSNDLAFSANSGATIGMRLNSSGNLGLGVTPSAWTNSFGVIQGLGGWSISHNGANSNSVDFLSNAYRSGGSNTYLYIASANATRYQQLAGVHSWYTAPSGTAGNAITFTQAMTLDASGNLLVGTTSSGARVTVQDTNNAISAGVTNGVFLLREVGGSSANNTLELNVRPNSGKSGYLTFTESGVADRWSIGIAAGDSGLLFRSGIAGTERMRLDSSGNLLVGLTSATGTAKLQVSGPLRTTGYTVATLPAGTVGMRTYVTDALAPTFGATVAAGGAVTIPVFYNGTNWIVG